MTKSLLLICIIFFQLISDLCAQTVIPNSSFESWTTGNYSNPTGWDTPNEELMAIPFLGFPVVTKSTDHHGTGSFSAKLETKHLALPPLDIPGFMTCGKLSINLTAGTFELTGGVPLTDQPTHLTGYYKYIPKGGDSCVIGIGLTKTTGAIKDTIGIGSFSTRDTVTDWTPFSAWSNYLNTSAPDSMNIIAMSTAQEVMTIGTVLYVDDLSLDYTVGFNKTDPFAGISVYNDQETKRLMIFFDFEEPECTTISLINMMGQQVSSRDAGKLLKNRESIYYNAFPSEVYLLEIMHGGKVFSKKFFLNQ